MKFLHVSDIHLGKRLYGCGLAEDQEHILNEILELAAREDVDAILIAGDVYNRAQPQPEALSQFSRFLTRLSALGKPVCIVRGNHDGEAQLAYAGPLLAGSGLYFTGEFDGRMQKVALRDGFGPVNVWLLPYFKPVQARRIFPEDGIESYADGVLAVLGRAEIDRSQRNVLVTHQFVAGAQVSDSEERSIGGLDQIPEEVFSDFDYVALGHLHKAQTLAGGRIRYCGAPLVYAFDECGQEKSATLVTLGEKGAENRLETVPFHPLRGCRVLEGTLDELSVLPRSEDYVQVHLTDAVRPLDPVGALRIPFPNLLNLTFAQAGDSKSREDIPAFEPALDPLEHFRAFYTAQNGREPSAEQVEIIREIIGGASE